MQFSCYGVVELALLFYRCNILLNSTQTILQIFLKPLTLGEYQYQIRHQQPKKRTEPIKTNDKQKFVAYSAIFYAQNFA